MLHHKLIKLAKNLMCIIGLIAISPFLLFAALVLMLEDGLPIFFKQDRIGQHLKIFKIIKIRTLKNSTPQISTHELQAKHRLNAGSLIRKIKLDEFPQLFNVIKGELNLVGPRPGLVTQEELLKFRAEREIFQIKPGITGLAQVMGYDMSNPKKLSEIDEIYVLNQSFKVDILIFLATFISFPKKYLSQYFKIEDLSSIK